MLCERPRCRGCLMEEPGRVTIAPNEVAADLVCTFLRAEGIRCAHRVTNVGAGGWDGVPNAGGAREVLVDPADPTRRSRRWPPPSWAILGLSLARHAGHAALTPLLRGGLLVVAAELLRIADSTLLANSPLSRDEKRE